MDTGYVSPFFNNQSAWDRLEEVEPEQADDVVVVSIHGEQENGGCIQSPGKAALVGLGILLIIGAAIAAGVLFTHLGYNSLACLSAVPVGIAIILTGLRCCGSKKSEEMSYCDREFPLGSATAASASRLQNLSAGHFSEIVPMLDDRRLALASGTQLNLLPWDKLLAPRNDRKQMLETIFAHEPLKIQDLNEKTLDTLTPFLNGKHLRWLTPSRYRDIYWEAILQSPDAKQIVNDMFPSDRPSTKHFLIAFRAQLPVTFEQVAALLNQDRLDLLGLPPIPEEDVVDSEEENPAYWDR